MFFFTRPVTPDDKDDSVDEVKCNQATVSELPDVPTPPVTPGLAGPGVRGLLSQPQEKAFDKFKALCSEQGLLEKPMGFRDEHSLEGINDEASLFRFLSARRFDAQKAYSHFQKAYQVRNTNKLCEFYENIDVEVYQQTTTLYPHWTGRRDKRGLPLYLFDISKLDSGSIAAHKKSSESMSIARTSSVDTDAASSQIRCAYAVHDGLTRMVMPLCSAMTDRPGPEIPVTKQLIIADISSLTLRQVWQLKSYLKGFSDLLALNYPEVLDRVLVIGAPPYFSTVWGWVKNWVDPVTVAKLQLVAPADVLPTLTSLIDIANIPGRYGGELTFEPGMTPMLDDKIRERLSWAQSSDEVLPIGPIQWEVNSDGSKTAVAVGIIDGEERRDVVATLH